MFGWKRQRKEEAVECAVLPPSTPAALVDAAVLPRGSSPSCVSSSEQMAEPASATQLPMPSSSGRGDGLELAAVGAGQRQPLERGSVRSKAAYFEALMRRRAAGGGGSSVDGSGGGQQADADMRHADSSSSSDDDAAEHWQGCPGAHCSAHDATAAGPSHGSGSAGSGGGSMSGRQHGSPEEMAALIEQLQGALDLKERQRKAAAEALARRTSECENLMRVVRELAQSRTKAVSQRASLAERYGELQQEYSRMLRIADLSRTVSKENLAKTSRTRSQLQRVQSELHATKSHAQSLDEKNTRARVENALLKEKVTLLERFDFEEAQESEVKKHFTRYRLAETY